MQQHNPLIEAHALLSWLDRQELLRPVIRIEVVKSHVRYMQRHGSAYESQFNPVV